MSMTNAGKIEVLLFMAGEEGLTPMDLAMLTQLDITACQQQVDALKESYDASADSALTIIQTADKYRLTTKEAYAGLLENYAKTTINQSLSKSAVEVLSIIAYKQPITRLAIDQLRGVNSSGVISNLRLFDLIESAGQLEAPGRPTLYKTTDFFLDYIGINSLADLPPVAEPELINEDNPLFNEEGIGDLDAD